MGGRRPYLWYGYVIRIYGKLFLGPEFQVTLLPSVRSSPCGNKGLGCGLQARKNSYCLNSVDLLKLSRVLMRLRRNAKSCYSCRPSDQGQLWELVAKLCYREDKRYIWLGLKKKKKKSNGTFWLTMCWPDFTWFGGGLGTRISSLKSMWYLSQERVNQRSLKVNYSYFYTQSLSVVFK